LRGLFWRAYALMRGEIPAPVRAVYRARGIEGMRKNAEWVALYRQPRSGRYTDTDLLARTSARKSKDSALPQICLIRL